MINTDSFMTDMDYYEEN